MKRILSLAIAVIMLMSLFAGCGASADKNSQETTKAEVKTTESAANASTTEVKKNIKMAFIFVSLEAEFWVASHKYIVQQLKDNGVEVIERNAKEDANKQLEMVKDAIAQKVDGIILIPQDGDEAVTAGKLCNEAGIPIGIYARPPSNKDAKYVVALSDNFDISQKAMIDMNKAAQERMTQTGKKISPLIALGDLGDPNAIERKNGFYDIINKNPDLYNKPVEIPGKWDAATVSANLTTALQANPDIDLIFLSSDIYLPPAQTVLTAMGKWVKAGDPKHVILGAVDGSSGAGKLLDDGFLDADGVHDLNNQAKILVDKLLDAIAKGEKTPEAWEQPPSFALTQYNLSEKRMDMWGNELRKEKGEIN